MNAETQTLKPVSQSAGLNRRRMQIKNLIPSTHGPLSRSQVLQGSGSRLQGVVVLTACEQRQVEPHRLGLVEQLQTFRGDRSGGTSTDQTRLDKREHCSSLRFGGSISSAIVSFIFQPDLYTVQAAVWFLLCCFIPQFLYAEHIQE